MTDKMFCYQCQEAAKGSGCTVRGVCGKTDDVARLQDLLIYLLKGISFYSSKLRKLGATSEEVDKFLLDGLFSTITNANFNRNDFVAWIREGLKLKNEAKEMLEKAEGDIGDKVPEAAIWQADTEEEFKEKAKQVGVLSTKNEDIRSLRELIIYGAKGVAAYAVHARNLGYEDEKIIEFIEKVLLATTNDSLSVDDLVGLVLECGKFGVEAMALLDKANTSSYGNPEITKVNIGVRNNPAILISGHDLKDMEELLKQTEGSGVDVYTHSEMLKTDRRERSRRIYSWRDAPC
jgi:hydroxylamine reductase